MCLQKTCWPFVYERSTIWWVTYNINLQWMVLLGWSFTITICLAVIYTLSIAYRPDYVHNPLEAAFYAGFHRLGWSLGLSWIVFACVLGYGGPVNSILAWRYWLPIGRLAYGAYLVQYISLNYEVGTMRNSRFYSEYTVVSITINNLSYFYYYTIFVL
jgi:peptidoglycan/LPS O-acetylase OafA/YrhL